MAKFADWQRFTKNQLGWAIGSGESIKVWGDAWLSSSSMSQAMGHVPKVDRTFFYDEIPINISRKLVRIFLSHISQKFRTNCREIFLMSFRQYSSLIFSFEFRENVCFRPINSYKFYFDTNSLELINSDGYGRRNRYIFL